MIFEHYVQKGEKTVIKIFNGFYKIPPIVLQKKKMTMIIMWYIYKIL